MTASQSFQFDDSTGATKTGQTLPLGAQAGALSLPTVPASDVSNIEPAGAPVSGAAMPPGGVGLTGWLSAIWSKLSGTLSVSAASLPLPIGAAQEAGGNLATIAANSASAATAAAQATGNASLATIASAQATAANQATGNGSLATIATNSGTQATAANQTTGNASLSTIATAAGGVADTAYVSGSGSLVALLKGIFGKLGGTLAVSAAALPLPTGAATSALQSSIVTAIGSPLQAGGNVTEANSAAILAKLISAPATAANQSTEITALNQIHTDMVAATPAGNNIIGFSGSLNKSVTVSPTITTSGATYSPNNAIGTVQIVSFFRTTGQPSATLSQLMFGWTGSEALAPVTFYIFSRNPTNSTFNDKALISLSPIDAKYLVTAPITLTPAAPSGSSQTFASLSLNLSVQNQDTTASLNLYVVAVLGSAASATPISTGDLFFGLSGVND